MSFNEVPEAAVFNSQDYCGHPDATETIIRGGQEWPRYVWDPEGRLGDLKTSRFVPRMSDERQALSFPEENNMELTREHLSIIDF